MRLTRPTFAPRRAPGNNRPSRTPTTEPGFTNANGQAVERATGAPSAARPGQFVYGLRCGKCGHTYGCNGLDIKDRCCPFCQGGVPGEAVREPQPGLFDSLLPE